MPTCFGGRPSGGGRIVSGRRSPNPELDLLILTATYGEGHRRASQAVAEALLEERPGFRVEILDFFTLAGRTFNSLVRRAYVTSVNRLPGAYGAFYRLTGNIAPDSFWQRRLNAIGREKLFELVTTRRPRAILCTYPTPSGVLSDLRRGGRLTVPVATLVTDYVVHSQWVHPGVDLYLVGAEVVADGLLQRGVGADRIRVTGLPVLRRFRSPPDPATARAGLGLPSGRDVVLVMGGGYGMLGDMRPLITALRRLEASPEILVVAGRNRLLWEKLHAFAARDGAPLRIFGFVEDVAELYAAADLLLTKPGGLTVAEALAVGVPMVIYRAIPGQEEANARFLTAAGAARWVRDPAAVPETVRSLLLRPEERRELIRAGRALARPNAAREVARELLRLVEASA